MAPSANPPLRDTAALAAKAATAPLIPTGVGGDEPGVCGWELGWEGWGRSGGDILP
jgi:hypothetical protein